MPNAVALKTMQIILFYGGDKKKKGKKVLRQE
jgi:hypothetical protein